MPGLYVHIPFCSIKCGYCDFTAFSGQNAGIPRYLSALELEASRYPRIVPDTLYLGGGTPTELSVEQLSTLLSQLSERYGKISALRESTVEANPESTTPAKLDVLERFGVSRLSLGLQSTSDRILKTLGRQHTWKEFQQVYREAQKRSFDLSVDLMLGVPGQSLTDIQESIERVLELEPQ